ncbi:MAG: HAMP domain-containing histidine kinase [Bacteroidaceae bacterium]|nr:HAMP domain-containing histidine kinase [Bacteroidaceae bacterium]
MRDKVGHIILFFIFSCLSMGAFAADDEILYISSYGTDAKYITENISTFISEYSKLTNDATPISIENLNCEVLGDSKKWKGRMREILNHHRNAKLIILLGLEATVTYMSLPEPEYRKIPLYCSMMPRFCAELEASDSLGCIVTKEDNPNGYVDMEEVIKDFNVKYANFYVYEPKKLIELSRECFPNKNNFIIICDNSLRGLTYLRLLKEELKRTDGVTYSFIDGRYRTMQDAAIRFKEMPSEKSVGIMCNWRYDANGGIFMNNGVTYFSRANNIIPMFSFSGSGMGYWTIGGYIPQYEDDGKVIAERAYREFFNKEEVPTKIVEVPTRLTIDRNLWNTWQLDESILPQETKFVNEESETGLSELLTGNTKTFLIVVAIIFVLLIGSTVYLAVRNIKHTRQCQQRRREYEERISRLSEVGATEKDYAGKLDEINTIIMQLMIENQAETNKALEIMESSCKVLQKENLDESHNEVVGIIMRQIAEISRENGETCDEIKALKAEKEEEIEIERINIADVCRSVIDEVNKGNNGIGVTFGSREQIFIESDRTLIARAVRDVITKMRDVMEECQVEIRLKICTPNVEMSITGIPQAEYDAKTKDLQKRNTIRLVTKTIVSRMNIIRLGGSMDIDKEYNEGTRFVFKLPIVH